MLAIESSLLKERINNDVVINRRLENALTRTLAVDSLLIALLLIIFLAEMRTRKKVEENLITSLNYLREANLVLKEQQVKGLRSTKTTIHDLKNPLGSIRGFAELISDELISSPSIREFSDVIKRISQSSLELVDSLLSSSDDVPTKMETVDVVAVLEEACTQIEVQARAKNQTIIRDFSIAGAPVLGNRMKLEELFMNLLSNAIKYSPSCGKIWVRCLPKEGVYKVEIEDQGQGFSNEDKARAFQYRQRLSAKPTGKESSTGFGLFVAKQVIELHNGHIKIGDSKSGVGACVSFELPARSDRDRESKATSPQIDLG